MAKKPDKWIWVKRSVITTLILANLMVGYALWQVNQVSDQLANFTTVPQLDEILTESPADPGDPITFLMLGSDSRENLPDDWGGDFGDFKGQRADVIMLVRAFPDSGSVQLLSLPRDLRVDVDGYGVQKVNAAYAFGGASLMLSTVQAELGIPIHHYVEIDFVGFAGLVDKLGGLTVTFPYPARDLKSKLSVEAGTQNLDGRMALAYARSRSYQELRDGQWVSADANDIGRTKRQQQLLGGILGQLKKPSNVVGVQSLVAELAQFMVVDPNFSELDLVSLAFAFRTFGTDNISAATLPTHTEIIDGLYYEIRDEPAATDALSAFEQVTPQAAEAIPTTTMPQILTIEVANGNGTLGAATRWAGALADMGFEVVSVVDYDTFAVPVTQIVSPIGSGYGELVFQRLGFGEVVEGTPGTSDVLIILGADSLNQPG
ncbi:MAG: LCP family protein [Acidimicrobiia bacterium]|nr:LCP family protein [Acidimicrobiia bacterium]